MADRSKSELLAKLPLFERLDDGERQQLVDLVQTDGKLAGTLIFRRGDPTDAFYVIARGLVEIVLEDGQRIQLGEGDFFGELGVMNSAPRTADAVAAEDSVLLRISKEDFDRVLTLDESIATKVMQACLERGRNLAVQGTGEAGGQVGEVLVFFSPRGGAGTTTLAVNCACRLADLSGKRVGLLDGDLQFGNCHILLESEGVESGFAQAAASTPEEPLTGEEIEGFVEKLDRGLDLVRSPRRTEEADLIRPQHLVSVIDHLRGTTGLVVVDTSSELTEKTLALVDMATRVFLVLEPEIVSVHRALDCLRLFELAGFPSERFELVLNKGRKGGIPPEEIARALERELYATVSRDVEQVGAAIHEGKPVVDQDRTAAVAIDLSNLARRFLNPFGNDLETRKETRSKAGFSLWDFFMGDDGEASPGKRA